MDCIDLTSKRSKMFKTFNTTQNNKSDQITTNCIDLMSKKSKERKTTKLRRKTFKTTQNNESDHIIIIASIWRQNHQNFWVRWQNYKSNQIIMHCNDLKSKRSKKLSYNAKLQTRSNYDQFASIWHLNYQKCWVTSQNIQNNAKLRKWSNYNGLHRFDGKNIKPKQNYKSDHITMKLHRFDVKTIKNVELRRKTFKTTQNNESDHIIIIASIWRQNDQNFWVRWQNYKSNQITMDCIDLTVKRSKQRKTTNKRDHITINLHRFDVKASKRSKMLCFIAKQSKNPKTTNMIKL